MKDTTRVNGKKEPDAPVSFRCATSRRLMLEAIQREKGHVDLSETLRDAVDAYIASWLRPDSEAA